MTRSLARIFCRLIALLSRAVTRLVRLGDQDPTQILLDTYSDAQRQAAESKNREAPPPLNGTALKLLVLIPFRDQWAMTEACLRSLASQDAPGLEVRVLLLDNGSAEKTTLDALGYHGNRPLANAFDVKTLRLDEPFNFSRLNNRGVASEIPFGADFLLCLNNDVELRAPGDLKALVAFAAGCPRLGALGCTLLFPDERVQHLFLAPGVKIVGAHPLKGFRLEETSAWFQAPRPVAAVTGAALLVGAQAFAAVGGFDEALPTVGQDLDLCLKLQKQGLTNWVLPHVRMLHKEGASRGKAIAKHEVATIYAKWGEFLTKNPFFSTRLSRYSETPAYRLLEPAYPWEKVLP